MNGTGFPIAAAGPVGIAWCRHGFYVQLVCIFSRSCPYNGRKGLGAIRRKENPMARGQRKSIDEKIAAKKELIEALTTRMETEEGTGSGQRYYHGVRAGAGRGGGSAAAVSGSAWGGCFLRLFEGMQDCFRLIGFCLQRQFAIRTGNINRISQRNQRCETVSGSGEVSCLFLWIRNNICRKEYTVDGRPGMDAPTDTGKRKQQQDNTGKSIIWQKCTLHFSGRAPILYRNKVK